MVKFIKKIKVNFLIRKSLRFFDKKEFDSALSLINEVLLIFPNCEKALYLKGKIYQVFGKPTESQICYEKIIKINSKFIHAWIEKAMCFAILKKYDEALKALDDGLNFNNNNHGMIRIKIQFLKDFGRYDECLDYINFVLKNVDKELGIELKAEMFLSEGKFIDSCSYFRKLCVLNSENINAWYGLSSASYFLGNLDDAIKYMENCIELDKKNSTFLLLYASYLIENELYDKSLKVLNKSIKKYNDFNFYYLRGLCLDFLNNEKKAEKSYKKGLKIGLKLVKLYPDENFHEVIGIILERLNYSDETREYFEKYNELNS